MERLKEEFDALGCHLSAHPLDAYAKSLQRLGVYQYADVLAKGRSESVKLAGTVISVKELTSAKGNRFAFAQLTDASGVFEITLFSELLAVSRTDLEVGNSIFVLATAQFEGDSVRFIANAIEPLERVAARSGTGLRVFVDSSVPLLPLHDILAGEGPGSGEVTVVTRLDSATEVEIKLPERYAISPAVRQAVKSLSRILKVQEL